jgi:thiol:disulfide interchange protein
MKTNIIKNIALLILLIAAVALMYLVPQHYGKIAIAILAATFYFNFIKDSKKAASWFKSGISFANIVLILGFIFYGFAQSKKQIFMAKTPVIFEHTSFETALSKAKKENKLVFIDFYASWCPPCLAFANDILTDVEVGSKMNASFVNIKYDAEQGEGKIIAKKYNVKAYPALMILDTNGNIIETVADENVPSKQDMIALSLKYKKE